MNDHNEVPLNRVLGAFIAIIVMIAIAFSPWPADAGGPQPDFVERSQAVTPSDLSAHTGAVNEVHGATANTRLATASEAALLASDNNFTGTNTIEKAGGGNSYLNFVWTSTKGWALGLYFQNSSYDFCISGDTNFGLVPCLTVKNTTYNVGIGTTTPDVNTKLHVAGKLRIDDVPEYADNASAIAGGLATGTFFRTATGDLKVVY